MAQVQPRRSTGSPKWTGLVMPWLPGLLVLLLSASSVPRGTIFFSEGPRSSCAPALTLGVRLSLDGPKSRFCTGSHQGSLHARDGHHGSRHLSPRFREPSARQFDRLEGAHAHTDQLWNLAWSCRDWRSLGRCCQPAGHHVSEGTETPAAPRHASARRSPILAGLPRGRYAWHDGHRHRALCSVWPRVLFRIGMD